MMIPAALVVPADITNCRLVMITPPAHADPVIGQRTNAFEYVPRRRFGRPQQRNPPATRAGCTLVPRDSLLITYAAAVGQP
jgi:hypothetical protein